MVAIVNDSCFGPITLLIWGRPDSENKLRLSANAPP